MRTTVLLLALALLPAGLRAEDAWYESYQDALKAIGSRKWAQAEAKLKAAMRTGPPAGRQVRTHGMRVMDYLPEYQLGVVYFNQQRYADALEQFAKVQASGLITRDTAEYHPLIDMSEICRIRTAGGGPADARKEAEALIRLARDLLSRGSPPEARKALESAREKDPGHPGLADAFVDLGRAEAEARAREEERSRPPIEKATEAPRPTAVERAAATATPAPVLPPRPRSAPDAEEAFAAFYAGRYDTAAGRFEELARSSRDRDRARYLFYAACSQAALALLRGTDAGRPHLERARALHADAGPAGARWGKADPLLSPRVLETLAAR